MTDYGLPTPAELGAPPQFDSWRASQDAAFAAAINCPTYAVALNCPTGLGKSLIAVSWRLLSGLKVCILTKTNALADQYMRMFAEIGLKEVRGMGARRGDGMPFYPCLGMTPDQHRMWRFTARAPEPSCEEGPCHDGFSCSLRDKGCTYYDAVRQAGNFTVTNYSFWLANQTFSQERIGPYDLLIMDEAHEAPDELGKFMAEEISTWEIETLIGARWPSAKTTTQGMHADDLARWAEWGNLLATKIDQKLEPSPDRTVKGRERKSLRKLLKKMRTVARCGDQAAQWIITDTPTGKVFEPVWPSPYRELLFRDVKQVAFMSATVRPKTLELLGLKPDEYQFHEFPSSFPVERRPIIRIPTCQIKSTTSRAQLEYWVNRIDSIIRLRLDRRGIIHTVNYKLAEFILEQSRYRDLMISHGRGQVADAIKRFRAAGPNAILVSPVADQGHDFPGRECEYQIIGKLAFPDTREAVVDIRCKQDDEYRAYEVIKKLVQQVGRGNRSAEDFCETFIIDDMAEWFFRKWGYLAPYHFGEAYREVATVPIPPEGMRAA